MKFGAMERLVAHARRVGETALQTRMPELLQQAVATAQHRRSDRADLFALLNFFDVLTAASSDSKPARSFWFDGLNSLTQQNVAAQPENALAVSLYGTEGWHEHADGIAIDLYGAGTVKGADLVVNAAFSVVSAQSSRAKEFYMGAGVEFKRDNVRGVG